MHDPESRRHDEPVGDCPLCAELAVHQGVATQLGNLAVWAWCDRFWRYDAVTDELVEIRDERALAECRRLAGILA